MSMIRCPECNNLVSDKAMACPTCGYPISRETGNPVYTARSNPVYSEHSAVYPQIREYAEAVKPVYTLSIIGLVLCLGIGFIFALVSLSMGKKLQPVDISNATPADIAEYQVAENKAKKAKGFGTAALLFAGAAILIGIFIGAIASQM
ncbi:MAG: hypothetical protein IK104_07240 [Clostridia bacterium]|nr:hypothetical protein [Clostridia bacterium]